MSKFEYSFGIQIEPDGLSPTAAANYVKNTRQVLQNIFRVDTGKLLLNALKKTGFWTHIKPYNQSRGSCNADFRGREISFLKSSDIFFSPNASNTSPCGDLLKNDQFNRGRLDHELLHHELVHSLRHLTGHFHKGGPVFGKDGMLLYGADSGGAAGDEEFYAILISNIFVTDPSNGLEKSGLRANWKTFKPLHKDYSDSFAFFESGPYIHATIRMFVSENKDYADALAKIPATFNPIAAIKKDSNRAQALSLSPQAKIGAAFDAFENLSIELPKQIRQLEHNLNQITKGR